MFDSSHRPDKVVVPACAQCNSGTKTSDLVVSIVSRWRFGDDSRELVDHRHLVARLRQQDPSIIDEWVGRAAIEQAKARKYLLEQGIPLREEGGLVSIGPKTIRQLNLFAHKLTLGLYFHHFKAFAPPECLLSAHWRTKEDYVIGAIPKELIDMFPDHAALQQGKWNTREQFEYRSATNMKDGLFGCLARLRTGLFVVGFALRDGTMPADDNSHDWIRPPDLLRILERPEFERRR